MFTGIVEEVGTVEAVREMGHGRELRIRARRVLEGLAHGDSVALDGACHTVVEFDSGGFSVQSVATTLERTTFAEFGEGRRVNLERAVALGTRLGGHLVQGHVDGVGRVLSVRRQDELVLIDFEMPTEVAEITILHGSITLDGVSLTVNALPRAGVAQVSIIPFTWTHTNLSELAAGSRVNLEGDLVGKYVRQLVRSGGDGYARPAAGEGPTDPSGR